MDKKTKDYYDLNSEKLSSKYESADVNYLDQFIKGVDNKPPEIS